MKRKTVILYVILGITAVIGIADSAILSVYSGVNVGILLPGAAGVLLLMYITVRHKLRHDMPILSSPVLRRALMIVMLMGAAFFLALEGMIIYNGSSQYYGKADYMIILGGGIKGEKVSPTLEERLKKGMEYLKRNTDTLVVVSGGQGMGETISEAEAMKRYLAENGIDSSRIIKEEKSTSTMENFKYTRELLDFEGKNTKKIIVVTNDFHMLRSKMLARRNGFEPYGISSITPAKVWVNCYLREFFALVKSYFIDR